MSNVEKCNIINVNYVKAVVKHNMKYQYMQTWCVDLMLSEKCCIYQHFKNIFFPQKYLTCLPNSITFRICNTRLPIEQGLAIITCQDIRGIVGYTIQSAQTVGDEFHLLLVCEALSDIRKLYLPRYYFYHTNMVKFNVYKIT